MEASSPSTSGSSHVTFTMPSTTRSVAALSGGVAVGLPGPGSNTLEALHAASRRSSNRRTQSHPLSARASARSIALLNEASRSVGPNTRSRKRRSTSTRETTSTREAASPEVLSPSPRKRARASLKKPPPQPKVADDSEKKPSAGEENCCICMCEVEADDVAGISGCDHRFCFGCIEKWAERENTCPLCKNRFNKIDRINKKRKKGQKNTKKVKQRDQRSDLVPGAALEGLLGRLLEESQFRMPGRSHDLTEFLSTSANFASRNPPSIARLIFSGIGNLGDYSLHGPTPRFSRSRSMPRGGGDDDSDEEESPLSSFIRAFHGHGVPVMQVVQPVTFTTRMASRSYASNSNDRNAGRGAENPLEIDDSDDDDVEVWTSNRGS